MSQYAAESPAWQRFWQLLLEAPLAPTPTTAAAVTRLDDEFDFLTETAAPPAAQAVAHVGTVDGERMARLASLEGDLPEVAQLLAQSRDALRDDRRLDHLDPAGAVWLFRALLLAPVATASEHGALVRLLQRSARAQLELIARLHDDPQSLGHDGIDRVLACLKQIADGRCVREMEALLVERGAQLSDVHAWQARHIVQVIRRSGRK